MIELANIQRAARASRALALKQATEATHKRLDKAIMAAAPFADRRRYGRFVLVQHGFHRDIDALYRHPALAELIPDLGARRRLGLIEHDLADLGIAPLEATASTAICRDADVATGLGWLYVAEGSNLGAAFLLKLAAPLGLSEEFGARHLAGAPEGRARHWREFTAALDAPALDLLEEGRVISGAEAAFARVEQLVTEICG